MKIPTYIMIHHTLVSYKKNDDQFRANNIYHKNKWNFKSSLGYYLGYNYEISAKGKVRQARKDGEKTAAAYQDNMNDGRAIHIALDGNFDIEKPLPAQIFALRDLLRKLVEKYKIPKSNIVFHRDYAPKTCPGNNMDINFIRSLIKEQNIIDTKNEIKQEIFNLLDNLKSLIKKL